MRLLIPIVALGAGVLAAILVAQSHSNAGLRRQVAALTRQNEDQSSQIEQLQTARLRSEHQRAELERAAALLEEQVRTQQLAAAAAPAAQALSASVVTNSQADEKDKAGLGNFLSKMMQNPDTKKFIRDQQRLMMDQMYAPLIKQLGLSPEEATQFKDLLAENAMNAAEKATAMFGASPTNRTEIAGALATDQKAFEEQIKSFLGEGRFAKYRDYQETVGDRTQLNLFRQQSGGDYPITDTQTEQLLTIIKEERHAVAAGTGQNAVAGPDNSRNFEAMLSPEQADKLLQSQETVNQRVFERARMILSPDQLRSLSAFQANQIQTMRMGMSMARQMFTPSEPAPAAGESNP